MGLGLLGRCATATALVWLVATMAAPPAGAEFAFDEQLRVSMEMGLDGDPTFNAKDADVAYDPVRDDFMVVWQGTQPGSDGPQIFARVVGKANERIGNVEQISHTPHELVAEEARLTGKPTIAFIPSQNEFLVLWEAKHDAGGSQIYGQRVEPRLGDLSSRTVDIPISETGTEPAAVDAHTPALAYDSVTGSALAVWSSDDEQNAKHEIHGRSVSGKTPVLGGEIRISTTAADGMKGAFDPAVAYDSVNRRYLVAWSSDHVVDNEREIHTRAYDGSTLGQQQRVSHMGPDGNTAFDAFDPSLAFDPSTHEYLLVWRGNAQNEQFEVYGQRLDANNGEVGDDDFRISDMGPDGNPAYAVLGPPSVDYLSIANRYLVVWAGTDDTVGGETEIFGQALGADGREVDTNDFRVTRYGQTGNTAHTATAPAAAYDPRNNQTLVVWQGKGASPLHLDETEIFSRPVGDDRDGDELPDLLDACPTVSGGPFDASKDGCPDDRDSDGVIDALDGCASAGGGAFDANHDGCPDDSDGDGVLDGIDRCGAVPAGAFDASLDGCPDDRDGDGLIDALDRCASVAAGAFDANRDGCPDDSDGDGVLDAADPCPKTAGGRLDVNRNGCPGPFGSLRGVRASPKLTDYGRYVLVGRLRFQDLPAARVTIALRCVVRCKLKETLVKPRGPRVVHSRAFKNKRLPVGAVITASITATDMIGSVRRYRLGHETMPRIGKLQCIEIGSTRPRTTCDPGR